MHMNEIILLCKEKYDARLMTSLGVSKGLKVSKSKQLWVSSIFYAWLIDWESKTHALENVSDNFLENVFPKMVY